MLWLHYDNAARSPDLIYLPVRVTENSLELSDVGRGNTLVWVRPAP